MFRRIYLVIGGIAASIAMLQALLALFELTLTGIGFVVAAALGVGVGAFGGAFRGAEPDSQTEDPATEAIARF